MRSWRERWDPDAEFVFTKRLRLGLDPEKPFVLPGEPVPKDKLSLSRLRRWWDANVIKLANAPDPKADRPTIRRLTSAVWEVRIPGRKPFRTNDRGEAERMCVQQPSLTQVNSQVWELQVPGAPAVRIRGRNKAQAALQEALV